MWSTAKRLLPLIGVLIYSLASFPSCGGGAQVQQVAAPQGILPLKITTTQPAVGMVGQAYRFQMMSSGGGPPYTWSLMLGQLPPGVSLNANTGMMAGVPTRAGNYSFTVAVADSTFSGQQSAVQSMGVAVYVPPMAVVTPNLPDGKVGEPYYVQLQATGGISPYTWSILEGSLAHGVHLDALTGEISGIPTDAGTTSVTIQVTDSSSPQNIARLMLGGAGS